MDLYTIALFVHIVGAVLVFVLLAIEGVGLRTGFSAFQVSKILGPISAVAVLVPGFYMAASAAGWKPWVWVGLGGYVLIAGLGAYTGINAMRGRISSQVATFSWLGRIGIAVGIVFDMTVKPNLVFSITAVAIATAIALGTSMVTRREEQPA